MATVARKKSPRRAQIEAAALYPLDWLEERSGLVGGLKYFLFRKVPATRAGRRPSGPRR